MPQELAWMIVAGANAGKEGELEALGRRAVAWSKGNEAGVREYAWRLSEETGACAIFVKIASPEAARAWLGNFEERFLPHLRDCATIQHTLVFCDPSPPIRKKLDELAPIYMKDAGAFVRAVSSGPSLMR